MRLKKFGIILAVSTVIAVPAALMVWIAAKPQPPKPTSLYLMDFNKTSPSGPLHNQNHFKQQQTYLDSLKKDVNEVLLAYKKQNPSFDNLNLKFIYLKANPQNGEINFFNELNKTFLAINKNLSFTMLPRTPVTVQQGYYQKNSDMVSLFWGPDYNGLGTWLAYMFSGSFPIANMWQPLAKLLNQSDAYLNQDIFKDNADHVSWPLSLKKQLGQFEISFTNKDVVPIVSNNHVITADEILKYAHNFKSNQASAYTTIQNAIASWANSKNNAQGQLLNEDASGYKTYQSFVGGIKDFKRSQAINLVDWMSSYIPNIPYVQDGPNTKDIKLVRQGAHIPTNVNAPLNYRDWYYSDLYQNGSQFRWWNPNDPFSATITAYNPAFTQSSNAQFFGSVFSPLFSWSSTGDFYNQRVSKFASNYDNNLVSVGTALSVNDFARIIDNNFNDINGKIDAQSFENGGGYIDLPIRAIPWVNTQGKNIKNMFLSPQDYWAGLKSYYRSVKTYLNSNSYFINLISLDIDKTLAYENNMLRNNNQNETKSLRLFFKKPELTGKNIADILSAGYFSAVPAFSPLVKNITDDQLFNKIAVIDKGGTLSIQATDMNVFYGSGNGLNSWNDLYFAAPYYISNVNPQNITFSLNPSYFEMFKDVSQEPAYNSFNLDQTLSNGQKAKKFNKIIMNYAGGYQTQITYEQFIRNQMDTSLIPTSDLNQAYALYENDIYEPVTEKVNSTNLIPYNTHIYQTDSAGAIILKDANGNEVDNSSISTDQYGNYVFPKGTYPSVKSRISPGYSDLIVKNFFTPIDATDKNGNLLPVLDRSSAILRTAISNLINWYSLTSIVYPTKTEIMQNSFLPYGVFNTNENSNDSRFKYWNIAAYKINQGDVALGKRIGGITQWTWDEYLNLWRSQFRG